jgi:ABC-type branched-subunit amino acid transport system substrate-binding protein
MLARRKGRLLRETRSDCQIGRKYMHNKSRISRRRVLQMAGVGAAAAAFPLARPAISQGAPLRVGLLLPYSGTFAALGTAITNAMDLYVKQQGGKLAGRTIEWIKVDDESAPPKATELTSKLVQGEKVDVLIGTVHSGVAMAMAKIAREAGLPTLIPNAGTDQPAMREEHFPHLVRQQPARRRRRCGDDQGRNQDRGHLHLGLRCR